MYLNQIYTLQTGVSLKVSTAALQELIANAIYKHELPEIEQVRSTTDLYTYLSVIVSEGAEDLIKRRHRWVNKQTKVDLAAGRPIPFNNFCQLFWRNLDEDDPDGDEWQQMIASDQFYDQLTILMNKLRITERRLQQNRTAFPDICFESA